MNSGGPAYSSRSRYFPWVLGSASPDLPLLSDPINQASLGQYPNHLQRPLWSELEALQSPFPAGWEHSLLNSGPDTTQTTNEVCTNGVSHPKFPRQSLSMPKICDFPGCKDRHVFQQDSAFKRHMNKHKRPYKCTVPNCKVGNFSNSGDLGRHQKTIHGKHKLICPVVTCKRHTKGFGRKDNWMEHLKRVHTMDSSNASNSVDVAETDADEDSIMGSGNDNSSLEEMETLSSISLEKASLMGKLKEKEIAKTAAKFDREIDALKIVLSLN